MPKVALSPALVKGTRCEQDRNVNLFDTQCTGLMLEVRPSGGRTYYVRYQNRRGRTRQHRLGSAHDLSLSQARQLAHEVRAKVCTGSDPAEDRQLARQVPTLAQFVEKQYLPYVQSYKRSWKTDECLLRNHVLPRLGSQPMDQISKGDIIELIQRHRTSHKPGSSNRVLIMLRYIFNLAVEWETATLSKNPTAGIPLYQENNKRERFLTTEESQRLFRELERSPKSKLQFIVPMLILTGARKSEVLQARWQNFDFERRIWRIEMTKAGQARHVPISDALVRLLAQIGTQGKSEWLFPNPKTGKPLGHFFCSWDSARKRAGLADVRIHDLRHSFASMLVNTGHSIYEVQKLLGHTQIKTTQRYAHLSQDTLLKASNDVGEIIYGQGNLKFVEESRDEQQRLLVMEPATLER